MAEKGCGFNRSMQGSRIRRGHKACATNVRLPASRSCTSSTASGHPAPATLALDVSRRQRLRWIALLRGTTSRHKAV